MPTLYTGTSFYGTISTAQEKDLFSVPLIRGLTYQFNADPDSLSSRPLTDSFLTLFTPAGNFIGQDDDSGPGDAAQIYYRATGSGNFLLEVSAFQNTTGDYLLTSSIGRATAAANTVYGTSAADRFDGRGGNDQLFGQGGNDWIWGNQGDDIIGGASGNDILLGGNGRDFIGGGAGRDVLRGGNHSDTLIGGSAPDTLAGGLGPDRFEFEDYTHSTAGAFDKILAADGAGAFEGAGFAGGDLIDLRAIDADVTRGGNQAFTWGGGFGSGHLRTAEYGDWTIVQGNLDNDRYAELVIYINDGRQSASAYYAGDFIL